MGGAFPRVMLNNNSRKLLLASCLAVALGALGGCAVRARAAYGYPSGVVVVRRAPPAPLVEVVPQSPYAASVWANGYWAWNGYDYRWHRGHWVTPPRAGVTWRPSGWVHQDGRYRFYRGGWTRPGVRARVYVHPAPRVRYGRSYRTAPPPPSYPAYRR